MKEWLVARDIGIHFVNVITDDSLAIGESDSFVSWNPVRRCYELWHNRLGYDLFISSYAIFGPIDKIKKVIHFQ
jgi:hypothetical protein